jgi:hypothetical protein
VFKGLGLLVCWVKLLYLEITDCESVKIWILQFLGAVQMADTIASSSALKEQGQSEICA